MRYPLLPNCRSSQVAQICRVACDDVLINSTVASGIKEGCWTR